MDVKYDEKQGMFCNLRFDIDNEEQFLCGGGIVENGGVFFFG